MERASYRVDIASRRVEKQLRDMLSQLDPPYREQVVAEIEALGYIPRPHGSSKIRGNVYRIRFGAWRIVYEILEQEKIVLVVKAGRRTKDFYTEFR